jgi:hypothetical protein
MLECGRYDRRAVKQSVALSAAAIAFCAAAGLLAHLTLAALPLLVLAWRLAPAWAVFAVATMCFGVAAFPDGGLGLANFLGIEDGPLRWACAPVPALWGLAAFAPATAAVEFRDEPRAWVRVAAAGGAWFMGPIVVAPIVALHPLLAAGAWFPNTGALGLAAMAALLLALSLMRNIAIPIGMALGVAMLARAMEPTVAAIPPRVAGIDLARAVQEPLKGKPAARVLLLLGSTEESLREGARTVILPESIVQLADGSADAFEAGARRLADRYGATIWVGVHGDSGGRDLSLLFPIAPGSARPPAEIEPLLTMPLTLWKPWHGLPPGLWAARPRRIPTEAGAVAPLVCFEALSPFAWLERAGGIQPIAVAFLSNQWWTASPAVGRVLQNSASEFARLQGAILLTAIAK